MKNVRSTVRNMNKITDTSTRDIILDVTEKLIYKSGIAATGMDLLVKTAGVSRKSIYRYFTNKDELVTAALQRRDVRWMHWYRNAVDQAETPADRLLNLFTVRNSAENAQSALIANRRARLDQWITLHTALGGNPTQSTPLATPASTANGK